MGAKRVLFTTAVVITAIATLAHASPAGSTATPTLTTDNGSVNIEVIQDPQTINLIEQVRFNFNFLNTTTGQRLHHVNHDPSNTDQQGNEVVSRPGIHIHEGKVVHSVTFPEAGSYTLTTDIKGTGPNEPFDTTHSGKTTANLTFAAG